MDWLEIQNPDNVSIKITYTKTDVKKCKKSKGPKYYGDNDELFGYPNN